jgi:hypothetical protein
MEMKSRVSALIVAAVIGLGSLGIPATASAGWRMNIAVGLCAKSKICRKQVSKAVDKTQKRCKTSKCSFTSKDFISRGTAWVKKVEK